MSQINVNRIKDSNEGAPDFPSGVNVGGVTSTITLGVTNLNPTNVNVSGVVTATTLDGNLLATGTPTLGLGVTINTSGLNISGVATAGIVSATTLFGDGSNLTGIALSIAPLNYNPAVYSQASHIAKASGIGLTFNQGVKAGSGNVTLSLANAGVAGTVVENFGVGNSVTYGDSDYGTTVTITPTADLSALQDYHLSYPSGAFTNIGGDVSFVGTAYTFKGRAFVNELMSWGSNNYGGLGQNNRTNYSSPVQIPSTSWANIAQSGGGPAWHSLATKTDGTLWTWGFNNQGQLGQNNTTHISSPVQVPGTTWPTDATTNTFSASSSYFNVAIKTDSTLWMWGKNAKGELGQNDRTTRSSPVQVPGTTWKSISVGQNFTNGVKTDGTLWSWGYNSNEGQLGLNNRTQYSSPVQIPGTTWNYCTAAVSSGIGVKTDATLWTWGSSSVGQLGQNNRTNYSSPVQIPGTSWATVKGGATFMAGTKTDGTMWMWGSNAFGALGQNPASAQLEGTSSPVQIPGTSWGTGFKDLNINYQRTMAIKTDGTLWAWGHGDGGQLGQNAAIHMSSPVQVPGNYLKMGGGYNNILALTQV